MKLNEEQLEYSLIREIARELVLEHNPELTEDKFEQIWSLCKGNPWNAGIVYQLLEFKNENK
jgi:hypothetical protein